MIKVNNRFYLAILGLCLFFVTTLAIASDKEAVEAAYKNWCQTMGTAKGNAEKIVQFYAPNAILLATFSRGILRNKDAGLNEYFTNLTGKPDLKCATDQVLTDVYGDIATNSGLYTFSFTDENGKTQTVPARFTFVYKKSGAKWLIVTHHSSQVPK